MDLPQSFIINNGAMITIGKNSLLLKYVDNSYEKSVFVPFSVPISLSVFDNSLLKIIINGESVEFSLAEFKGDPKLIVKAFDYATSSRLNS